MNDRPAHRFECDCGAIYHSWDALFACQNSNHGQPAAPLNGELTDANVQFRPGGRGANLPAIVKIDLYAALYHALGPIAARHGKATTPFINKIVADYIGQPELGDVLMLTEGKDKP